MRCKLRCMAVVAVNDMLLLEEAVAAVVKAFADRSVDLVGEDRDRIRDALSSCMDAMADEGEARVKEWVASLGK